MRKNNNSRYFNIHDIITIGINTKYQGKLEDMDFPLIYYETEKIESPDIVLNIGKFRRTTRPTYIIDHKYFIGKNYVYVREADPNSRRRWEFEIIKEGTDQIIVNFNPISLPCLDKVFYPNRIAQELVLFPLLMLSLAERGYFMLHSSGVSWMKKGFVFSGRPGSFKSTLALKLVRKGAKLLGDDWTILYKDKVYSLITSPITFEFKLRTLKTEEFSGILSKVKYVVFSMKRKKTIKDKTIFEESPVKVEKVFVLMPTISNKNFFEISNSNNLYETKRLIINNISELIIEKFYNIIIAIKYVFPETYIDFEKKFKNMFEQSSPEILKIIYNKNEKTLENIIPTILGGDTK